MLASILVYFWTSGTPKNRALAVARCYFCGKQHDAPGAPKSSPKGSQNRCQKPPWSLQEGFKTRLKKCFEFGPHFQALFVDLGGPRGVKMASKIASKTASASKLGLSTPGSPPGAHPRASILEPPGADFRMILERIFACIFDPPVLHFGTSAVMAWQVNGWSAVAAEPYSIKF